MSSVEQRLGRIDLRRLDYLAAALLMVDLIFETVLEHGIPDRLATALLAVPFGATIAVRRRWPAGALIGCSVVALVQEPFHGQLFSLDSQSVLFPFGLCAYGAGAWMPWRRGLVALAVAILVLCVDQAIQVYVTETSGSGGLGAGIVLAFILLGVPWLVGRFIGERRRRAEAFAALADQTEAEQAQRERAAIEQEHVTIGRELQDIIAHSVSVMVVQAGGARRLLGVEPDRARESILNVERTGRETLAEMRRLLGLLRKDADPRALAPQPGLDQLDELVSTLADLGLRCDLDSDSEAVELTPGIDLVGYRVLEAALTRAAEGGCTAAAIRVRCTPGWLELEVNGDCPLLEPLAGLASVRERVDLYGGRLIVDAAARFRLRCELPLEATALS